MKKIATYFADKKNDLKDIKTNKEANIYKRNVGVKGSAEMF